ncbi:hypothetical protein SLE2022_392480 [Rubroshorea leprosula]
MILVIIHLVSPETAATKTTLNNLLSSLSNASNITSDRIYNTTVGRDPNIVYGLFLCRGNVTIENFA